MAENSSTFHELVTEISTDEREQMLKKMKKGQTVESPGDNLLAEQNKVEAEQDLGAQLKRQPLFMQFWFWLVSVISNNPVEDVFNRSLVAGMARTIEKNCPGLLAYHRHMLSSTFYEKMVQLKSAAHFFTPYIEKYEENIGNFYTLLGYLIVPSVGEAIARDSDPYHYSFEKALGQDIKTTLLRKLEDALNDISSAKKAEMYASVRAVEWLRQFTKIPFDKIIAQFAASAEGVRETMFGQVKPYFSELARVMCNYTPVTNEVVQALYLFSERTQKNSGFSAIDGMGESSTEYVNAAAAEVAAIKQFMQTVPIYNVAKVIFENSQYIPDAFGGGEDWYIRFKDQWKFLFERRWEHWNRDFKKEKLKGRLQRDFMMADFPVFPYRPWVSVPGKFTFQYELTLGFIYHFMKNEFAAYRDTLQQTALEGEFSLRENRLEFTDAVNLFGRASDDLSLLANQLSAGGEYGLEFGKYEGDEELVASDRAQLESSMSEIESFTRDIVAAFGKACRSMKNLMGGILAEKITAYYGPLVNLMKIRGRDNKAYRETLVRAKLSIDNAYEMVQELEPLDIPMDD